MNSYFAYGTLLDSASMASVAPSASSLGVMRLDGYQLGFARCADGESGGCTLNAKTNAVTYGVLYRMSEEDLEAMDHSTVAGQSRWVHKAIRVIDSNGQAIESRTYVIPGNPPPIAPSADYVRPILRALEALDLPRDYAAATAALIATAQKG